MSEYLAAWKAAQEAGLAKSPAAQDGRPADGVPALTIIALALLELTDAVKANTAAMMTPPGQVKK